MLWRYPVLTWLCWLPLMVTHRFVDLLFFNPTHNNPCCCIIGPRTPSLSTMGIQYILQCAACSRARIIVTMENRGQSLLWRNTPANHCGPCRFSIPAQNWRENTFARFTTDSHWLERTHRIGPATRIKTFKLSEIDFLHLFKTSTSQFWEGVQVACDTKCTYSIFLLISNRYWQSDLWPPEAPLKNIVEIHW